MFSYRISALNLAQHTNILSCPGPILCPLVLQGAEAVLVAAAEQLGPAMLQTLPAAWQHMAGPLLPPGFEPNQLAAAFPAGDAQVCFLSGLSVPPLTHICCVSSLSIPSFSCMLCERPQYTSYSHVCCVSGLSIPPIRMYVV